jgi:hypothetical protein
MDHRFPRSCEMASIRTAGRIEVFQCNNCLAVKVFQRSDITFGSDIHYETKETIVEPPEGSCTVRKSVS